MYQGYATVDGVTYTGRTAGESMVFRGKRCAKQWNVKTQKWVKESHDV
jgi:hypothetical protein